MMHRLREVLEPQDDGTKLGGKGNDEGPVEVDETFVGGLTKNMHRKRANSYVKGSAPHGGKTIVMGMLDRDLRQVRATVVPNVKRETLQNEILKNVKYGSKVVTDEWVGYDKLHAKYVHDVVNLRR
jgi:hypothetical protein